MEHADHARIDAPTSDSLLRAAGVALIAILLAGILVLGLALLTRGTPAATVDRPAAHEVTDGWSAYLGAAASAPAGAVTDGWRGYLGANDPDAPREVDGWMTRYGNADD